MPFVYFGTMADKEDMNQDTGNKLSLDLAKDRHGSTKYTETPACMARSRYRR
ncbi:hypothetical protein JCM10914A_30700 [Paenibacillus sp. JCM 10914]|uniref:hypothetical protein n=1 Tax=Paenibacillus sp. JCM 10914 TaxID=1236974 RepID=UPI001E4BF482|nr:hypothetical protein [Paenibacillus sp. JCM 10914]